MNNAVCRTFAAYSSDIRTKTAFPFCHSLSSFKGLLTTLWINSSCTCQGTYLSFCCVHAKGHTCHFVVYMPRYTPVISSCTCQGTYLSFCRVHAKVHTCHFVVYMPRYIPVILSCTCPLLVYFRSKCSDNLFHAIARP